MTRFEHYRAGRLYGIKYTFERLRDQITEHTHVPSQAHNIIVLKGRVWLAERFQVRLLQAGTVLDFEWGEPHQIVAAEDDSQILNLYLNGMPEGYDRLPPEELVGVADFPPAQLPILPLRAIR